MPDERDDPTTPTDGAGPSARTADLEARAARIVARLREAGHRALFAGGCVRDRLLGRPIADVDIATSARPEEVRRLFRRTIGVGAAFGVIVVIDRPREGEAVHFEVATFRSDGDYGDGRRPDSITFCDDREDALRRDLTVNALFWDPDEGNVIDHVGGVADIEARVIRAVGDPRERFAEDHLRLLRAARFAARLDFELEAETAAAIRELAPKVATVSAERIRDEMTKIITHPSRRRGLELTAELGLLAIVLPEVDALRAGDGARWKQTLGILERLEAKPTETLLWGGLLHELDAKTADAILERLRFSTKARVRAVELVRDAGRFGEARTMSTAALKRFLRRDGFEEHLELHRVDRLAAGAALDDFEHCRDRLAAWRAAPPADGLRPPPLVTGGDLKGWGYPPGPAFKTILTAVEDAQLEGTLRSKDEAEAFVRERMS